MRTTSRVGITWSNLIQVLPTTNKFEILTNLCDQNISKCSSYALNASNSTSKEIKKYDQKKIQQPQRKTQGNINSGKSRQKYY
jgi:hypothetical protein